jgi:hypothetical protein
LALSYHDRRCKKSGLVRCHAEPLMARDVRAENVKGRVRFVIPHHEIGPADRKPPIRTRRQRGAGAVEAALIHAGGGRGDRTAARKDGEMQA